MHFDHSTISAREFRVLCSGDSDEHVQHRLEWHAQITHNFARHGQPDGASYFAALCFKYAREIERREIVANG